MKFSKKKCLEDTLSCDHHFRSNNPGKNMGHRFGRSLGPWSHHWDKAVAKLPTFDF